LWRFVNFPFGFEDVLSSLAVLFCFFRREVFGGFQGSIDRCLSSRFYSLTAFLFRHIFLGVVKQKRENLTCFLPRIVLPRHRYSIALSCWYPFMLILPVVCWLYIVWFFRSPFSRSTTPLIYPLFSRSIYFLRTSFTSLLPLLHPAPVILPFMYSPKRCPSNRLTHTLRINRFFRDIFDLPILFESLAFAGTYSAVTGATLSSTCSACIAGTCVSMSLIGMRALASLVVPTHLFLTSFLP
jgi:hypothetical protein